MKKHFNFLKYLYICKYLRNIIVMKKVFVFLMIIIGLQSFSQFGYKKFYFTTGITGQYLTTSKYTGFDVNLTFIPRYNFVEFNPEATLSVEIRPQIGAGFRNWYSRDGRHLSFPTRVSYASPLLINFNWGLSSEENSQYLFGLYIGCGYNYANVISKTPSYEAIHGFVIDAGIHFDSSPISHLSLMYTFGNKGNRIYGFGFYYDF